MKDFIIGNFEVRLNDQGKEIFKSRLEPESWTDVDFFVGQFSDVEPNYIDLSENVGDTGLQLIFDEWKGRGII